VLNSDDVALTKKSEETTAREGVVSLDIALSFRPLAPSTYWVVNVTLVPREVVRGVVFKLS
jgi:hypothetical protein